MFRRLIYLLLLLPMACIDPYQVDVPEGEQLLTVEGMIHSGESPQSIMITRSATYGSVFEGLIRPETGATVIVRDDEGNVTFLQESADARGSYFTPGGFRTQVGKSYTLQIQTDDGRVYTSFPEKVEPVPPIQGVEVRTVTVPVEGQEVPRSGVQLIAEIDDPAEENNYYFWRNGPSVYILETRPDLFFIRPSDANPDRTPAPKPCCVQCFRTEAGQNKSLFVSSDDNFNGLTAKLPVSFIEDDGLRFVNRYRVDLKQYSISESAYRFLRLVKQQAEINGSIFDPPPATIRGNIISLDNPDEVVLGYFLVGAEATRRVYVSKDDLTFKQNKAIITDDCREVSGATVDPPFDWGN